MADGRGGELPMEDCDLRRNEKHHADEPQLIDDAGRSNTAGQNVTSAGRTVGNMAYSTS